MATPTHVQAASTTFSAAVTVAATLTSVAAASALGSCYIETATNFRKPTITDNNGGTWSHAVVASPIGRQCRAGYAPNHASGTTIVTANWSGNTNGVLVVWEVAGANTVYPIDVVATNQSNSTTTHVCANGGLTSYGAEVLVYSGGTLDSTAGVTAIAAGTGTSIYASFGSNVQGLVQYQTHEAGASASTVNWTTTGSNRTSYNFCLAFTGLSTGRSITRVAASADDAEMYSSPEGKQPTGGTRTMALTGQGTAGSMRMGNHAAGTSSASVTGFRFQAPGMAQAATISAAILIITSQDTYNSAAAIDVVASCEDADDAAAFTTTAGNMDGTARPRTGGTTVGTLDSGQVDVNELHIDREYRFVLTSAVQAVVNRAGYAAGNDIACLIDVISTTADSEWQEIYPYDVNTIRAAKLLVYYTNPASGSLIPSPSRRNTGALLQM